MNKEYHKRFRITFKEDARTPNEMFTMFLRAKSIVIWKKADIFYHNFSMYRVTRVTNINGRNFIVYLELYK
jgi:hypothetical protein